MRARFPGFVPALFSTIALGLAWACAPGATPSAPQPAATAIEVPATAPAAAPAAPQTVRYGDLKLLPNAGVYVAMDEGYFAEQGISLDLTTFDSAANMVAPLGTNQLEAGGGAMSAGLYNAIHN